MVVGRDGDHVRDPKHKLQGVAEGDSSSREGPSDGNADRQANNRRRSPDQQRVTQRRHELVRPLIRSPPVVKAPAARFSKPVGSGVEAIDQNQKDRPDHEEAQR